MPDKNLTVTDGKIGLAEVMVVYGDLSWDVKEQVGNGGFSSRQEIHRRKAKMIPTFKWI